MRWSKEAEKQLPLCDAARHYAGLHFAGNSGTILIFWIVTGRGDCNITDRGNGIENSWLDSLNL